MVDNEQGAGQVKENQEDVQKRFEKYGTGKNDSKHVDAMYDECAHHYEQDLMILGYDDHIGTADAVEKAGIPKDALINDFGCGTGLIGDELVKRGYAPIDGCDASEKMLDICKTKGTYKDVRQLYLCKQQIPEEWKGKYDCIVSAGLMTFDHCDSSVLEEKYSCLRKDGPGIIIFTMRPHYMDTHGYGEYLKKMEADGRIEPAGHVEFMRYYKSDENQVKDERFKPTKVFAFIYKAKWPAA